MQKQYFILLPVLMAVGCASHSIMRGSVVMKTSDQEGHVCLGSGEVKVGDKVSLYRNECDMEKKKFSSCKKVLAGEGTVTELLNDHYSVVKVAPGVSFREGTVVEKQ